jgi:hypothetical protein
MFTDLIEAFTEAVNTLMDAISSFFQWFASTLADGMSLNSHEARQTHTFVVGDSGSKALSDSKPYD